MFYLAAGHMSAHAAHALSWLVIAVALIAAARGLLWLLGWR